MLVSPEQLPEVLARLRGSETDSAGNSRRDPVAQMTTGYDEVDGEPDEDTWGLTGRE